MCALLRDEAAAGRAARAERLNEAERELRRCRTARAGGGEAPTASLERSVRALRGAAA
ncbi:hypothetical protein [Catenuloplanes indicus]|uniref:Uncharacterized protein n=1 Tax=Catenuloplanes indicus TaxID=137267 RepID=A0AAE3VX26_9ACTN|nr:hypothetical protein [Catenuloplanes indicus]MDQ0365187.1 hypothetical protein [Catenuloplanes indicus]